MATAIEYTKDGRVAHLRFGFGDLNLFTPETVRELRDAVESIRADSAVLTIAADRTDADPGSVPGLSGGMDLRVARDFSPAEGRAMLRSLYELCQAVRDFAGVTVCGCGAYALGAGFELALSCDFRVATDDAALGLPEVDVGIPTLVQGGLLIRLVGVQAAKELCFLGEPVSGRTAAEMGLVNAAVPEEAYEDTVAEYVDRLAEKSPTTLRLQKAVFRGWRSHGVERGMEESVDVAERAFETDDLREGMDAFVEGREPAFDGRSGGR